MVSLARRLTLLTHRNSLKNRYECYVKQALWQCQRMCIRAEGPKIRCRNPLLTFWPLEWIIKKKVSINKVVELLDVLQKAPEHVRDLEELERFRVKHFYQYNQDFKEFLRRYGTLFEVFKTHNGKTWVGLTGTAEELLMERRHIIKAHEHIALNSIRKFLMMSTTKRIEVKKILYFRKEFLLPDGFQKSWIHKFPEYFVVVKKNDVAYLQLTSWDPALAITEVEKQAMEVGIWDARNEIGHPGWLRLPFPLKFPPMYKKDTLERQWLEKFQRLPYPSPYMEKRFKIVPKIREKRTVAVLHEMLSLTLEKNIVTDYLTHFRHEFKLPEKLMRYFLWYYGIFYVSRKGKRHSVYLTSAFDHVDLIEKSPLTAWKEKIAGLIGEDKSTREKRHQNIRWYCRRKTFYRDDVKFIDSAELVTDQSTGSDTEDAISVGVSDSEELQIDSILKDYI